MATTSLHNHLELGFLAGHNFTSQHRDEFAASGAIHQTGCSKTPFGTFPNFNARIKFQNTGMTDSEC